MVTLIRRIDDLGRISIPKDIRSAMNIVCGDPLQIAYDNQRCIITAIPAEQPIKHALDILSETINNQAGDLNPEFRKAMLNSIKQMREAIQKEETSQKSI